MSNKIKVTFDHNCIINAINKNESGLAVKKIANSELFDCAVIETSASEINKSKNIPDNYYDFNVLLDQAGLLHLSKITCPFTLDVSFINHATLIDYEDYELLKNISQVLFGNDFNLESDTESLNSKEHHKWLNKYLDSCNLWTHIYHGRDVFVTNDKNFMKKTKLHKLIELGAKKICRPEELILAV